MSPWFFTLLLLHSLVRGRTAADVREVTAMCGKDCVLACGANEKPGVQYRAVRWYKLRQPGLRGLLARDLPDGATYWYNNTDLREPLILLDESNSIVLLNVTCADSGVYTCHLSAPLGEQNREGEVLLRLTGCPESEAATFDTFRAVFPVFALVFAFLAFGISYLCLRNTIRERSRSKQKILEAPPKPLEEKDLMLIYRLGPKPKTKHVFV